MKSISEITDILINSTGTGAYHRFSPIPHYPVATDGVIALAEAADCFWLLDVIGSYSNSSKLNKNFQIWKLVVNRENDSAIIQCCHDTGDLVLTQKIEYTDFPMDTVTLYVIGGVILLPSEY